MPRLSPPVAFAVVAATFVWVLAASSAPSPLYVVYQESFAFSEFTLTTVFAVYVLALIAALLVAGSLSDHIGRKPVLLGAIALEAVSLVLFLLADGVGWLLVARVVQGVATGAATATLPATLVDLAARGDRPERAGVVNGTAPLSGLAVGALGCGLLVEYAPARDPPGLGAAARRPGPGRRAGRPDPGDHRPSAGGARVAAPAGRGAAAGAVRVRRDRADPAGELGARRALPLARGLGGRAGVRCARPPGRRAHRRRARRDRRGDGLRAARARPGDAARPGGLAARRGTVVTLAGVLTGVLALAAVGAVVAGLGFGSAAYATFGTMSTLAAPHERGELFAALYTLAYLAFSVPAMVAGVAATLGELRPTALVYGGVVAVLAVVAAVLGRRVPVPATGEPVPAPTRGS
ncbi:MFS transporter [Pseudonocardia sp. ICBG601]|uniref:MFS transporter n=1 Tax=Pseudonocardia sp. ICBG601 TaxID=2846759 RepID=UPI001CF632C8|nr:MFS transporter [Pseudonocardia sp. ICBG601]